MRLDACRVMFSSSNSFLGGANSGRPGQQQQPPYLQQPYSQYPPGQQPAPPQQPQPTGFMPQQTGFAPQPQFASSTGFGGSQLQPQLQPQATGFPGGGPQLQPQFTGFPGGTPQQQQQQPQLQPQATAQPGFLSPQPPQPQQQPQFTGYAAPQQQQQQQQQQPPLPQVQVQGTGMPTRPVGLKTSAEMADSFSDGARPQPPPKTSGGNKIPSIRLSFITAQDQAKFEQLFKSAVGEDQTMDGDKAKDLLMRSKLPGSELSRIW